MLNLQSADDLPSVLHDLGKNNKKANDACILQAAIDQHATAPACIANEFTKPQLSTHIINKFCSYAWAAMGNKVVMDSIMLPVQHCVYDQTGHLSHGCEIGMSQSSGIWRNSHELL